jgi:thioredoxin-related protein
MTMKKIWIGLMGFAGIMILSSLTVVTPVENSQPVVAEEGPVKWMTFEEAVERSKKEKRKIFIDVYTDWCGWCKVMDKNTFTDPTVAKVLNEKFYAVKFNAEQKEDVTFRGTTFKFIPSGRSGYHQLAAALLNNQLSYPNFVFLTDDFQIVPVVPGYSSLPGYRKPEEFHLFLSYIADDQYRSMKIEDYQRVYKSPYPATPANN